MKSFALSIPKDLALKDRHNWNFSGVPATEHRAACIYEYARESRLIRGTATTEAREAGLVLPPSGALLVPFFGHPDRLDFTRPWQALAAETRAVLVGSLRKVTPRELAAGPGPRPFAALNSDLLARFKPLRLNPGSGGELMLAAVNWQRTDEELMESFKRFLTERRPAQFPTGKTRGKGKEATWRVNLERLGIMRLLRHHNAKKLEKSHPEGRKLYEKHAGPEGLEGRELYKERKRALATFYGLFPFLREAVLIPYFDAKGERLIKDSDLLDELPFSWPAESV